MITLPKLHEMSTGDARWLLKPILVMVKIMLKNMPNKSTIFYDFQGAEPTPKEAFQDAKRRQQTHQDIVRKSISNFS